MNKIEQELEACNFTIHDLKRKQKQTDDKEISEKIQETIQSFEEYRIELLEQTQVLPKELIEMPITDTDKQIQKYKINNTILEDLTMLEHEQWVGWSKSIAKDLEKLIRLTPIEELTGEDQEFIISQLDRLDRWNELWVPYTELTEEIKEVDRVYAKRVLDRLYFKHNIKI